MPKKTEAVEIEGRRIAVSNLDKVLYPATHFTKGQVIDYYIRASKYLLPHLKDRPVTLKRFPDGVNGDFFYEKNAPSYTPEWIKRFAVPSKTRGSDIHYILINNLATLVWLANTANLEIHPFLHRVPRLERPTSVVFDLDPGEGSDVLTCAQAALNVREILDGAGLKSYAKVSGSKGIQIYVPLNTQINYDVTTPFAKAVAELMAQRYSDLIVSRMAKNLRATKVFIDWSQNSEHKTTVSVYSLRAKSDRPFVSLPVTWDELANALKSGDPKKLYWEPEPALARVERTGDLFQAVLELKQRLPSGIIDAIRAKTPVAARTRAKHSAPDPAGSVEAYRRKRDYRGSSENAKPAEPRIANTTASVTDKPNLAALPNAPMRFVEPMMAKAVQRLPEGREWNFEIKLDGYRTLVVKTESDVQLFSRRGNRLNKKFPTIASAFDALASGTMLDGEVVALDANGRPSFDALQNWHSRHTPIYFYAFDLLAHDGKDLRRLPLSERRRLLEQFVLQGLRDPIRISPRIDISGEELLRAVKAQGLEGVVAKRADSAYRSGEHSDAWVKYKTANGQELVIGGYMPGKYGFDSLLVGYYEGSYLQFAGKVRNGFVPVQRQQVASKFKGLETNKCPFANPPEPKAARRGEALTAEAMKKYRWLKPKLVARIEFADWTAANHLRHARFAGLRDDKDPRHVTREVAA